MDRSAEDYSLRVFMLPWLAHGHISPFLELAKSLTKRNIFVYFCSTPINLQSITPKIENHHPAATIQLVELHLPSSPELPPHLHTTKGLPPHLLPTLMYAFQRSVPKLSDILKKVNPDIVIPDVINPWIGELASSLGIPAMNFQTTSATSASFFMHMINNQVNGTALPQKQREEAARIHDYEFPLSGIYLHEFEVLKLITYGKSLRNNNKDMEHWIESPKDSCNTMLIKSCRELEGEAVDYFSAMTKKKVLLVGHIAEEDSIHKSNSCETPVIKWLNKKGKNSSVYVSFGSEYFMSKEDMEEIAYGLELSEVNFIWVIRFPKEEGNDTIRVLEEELPKGYLERVGERGMIIEGWAPQVDILRHESVRAFMSHCGWGSVMESMKCGVPIIALPMQLDQPMNARQIVKVGVAVEPVRDKSGNVHREEVEKAIRQVVVDESGEDVRRKVGEMAEKLRLRGDDEEIDVVIHEMLQICGKKTRGNLTYVD